MLVKVFHQHTGFSPTCIFHQHPSPTLKQPVDPNTDSGIQETINSEFEHCTVLTIAHRLKIIINSDRGLRNGSNDDLRCSKMISSLTSRLIF